MVVDVDEVTTDEKRALPAVVFPNSRVLILGTAPGDESLARQEYYASRSNQLWKIRENVYGDASLVAGGWQARRAFLEAKGLAFWDVLASCERKGSLDGNIENPIPNDFIAFFRAWPRIKYIFFNGQKAEKLFFQYVMSPAQLEECGIVNAVRLPSTSGANAIALSDKVERWRAIRTITRP